MSEGRVEERDEVGGHVYAVRYQVEPWNKPRPPARVTGVPGIKVSVDNYGYTDVLLAASVIKNDDGSVGSILLMDSESSCMMPPRWLLEAVRDQIDHHLWHHCEG